MQRLGAQRRVITMRTLLQTHAVFELQDAKRRARHAPKAQRMAQAARDLVGGLLNAH